MDELRTLLRLVCRLAVLPLICAAAPARAEAPVPIAAPAAWVEPIKAELDAKVPHKEITQGLHHLLVDTQVHVPANADPEYFFHYVRRIVNQTGVEQGAQLNLDYNPVYESLVLHEVAVWREGRKLDKLGSARMSLVNREKELDELLYLGEMTLHLVLDDIGVGDVLEFSYTIKGQNPIFDGVFAYSHYAEWSVPVHRLSIAVNWHKPRPLYRLASGRGLEVRESPLRGGTRYTVEQRDIKGQILDEHTPHWFDPYAIARFSESANWKSVADWARPLMESGVTDSPAIATIAAGIARDAPGAADRIAAALRYVQSEVRYFGIEIGENSHRPARAEETLARRYGDCKDKTVLLLSILRALGIEAYAALVNTGMRRELRDALPGHNLFNHVIVSVVHKGRTYWFDPTLQYQSGGLGAIHQPDYGYALMLRPGADELTDARPRHQAPSSSIVRESFDLSAGRDAPVLYTAHTQATGRNAEKIRRDLAMHGTNKVQHNYLDFYKEYYPSIETAAPPGFTDRPERNEMEVRENYSIASFWEQSTEEKKHYAWFYANAISPQLRKVQGARRNHPLALNHPVNVKHFIEVSLHDYPWRFDKEEFVRINDFFSFHGKVHYDSSAKKLLLEYSYESKTDFVPPDRIDEYGKAIGEVSDQTRYGIFMKPAAAGPAAEATSPAAGNTPAEAEIDYALYAVLLYIWMFGLIFVAWRVHQARHPCTAEAAYFPVALPKFAVMWICTLGLYGIYWCYRNWLYVKQRDQSSIMPVARAIFMILWFYPLYADLRSDSARRFGRSHLPGPAVGALLAVGFIAVEVASVKTDYALASTVAGLLLMLPLANYILFANRDHVPALAHNSQWSPRHFALILIVAPLLLYIAGSESGLLPGDSVIRGANLPDRNLKFLQRNGVVRPDDAIEYFYSDAILSIRDDGNGFSDRHVFSYWVEDGRFILQSAAFEEIKDIRINWGKVGDNTTLEVVRDDDSRFTVYAATAGRKDRLFVDVLLERWKERRQPADAGL